MPRWIRWVLSLAALRVVLALVGTLFLSLHTTPAAGPKFPLWIFLLQVLDFGAVAAWLILGGRTDERSKLLGGFYLLVGSAFSGALLRLEIASPHVPLRPLFAVASSLPLEAFLPALLWRFLDGFPRVDLYRRGMRLSGRLARVSALAGAVMFAVNLLLLPQLALSPAVRSVLGHFSRNATTGLFWLVLFALLVPGIPFMIWKARHAEAPERRRVLLFVLGFAIGAGPLFLQVLLESLVPPIGRFMMQPEARRIAGLVLFPAFLTVPITTAYSVRVHRALDVRLVVRKAAQYVLARSTLTVLALAPFLMFLLHVYARREQPIASLLRGQTAVVTLSLAVLGLLVLLLRRRLLRALDRRFFREEYDAQQVLTTLAESMRGADGPQQVAERVAAEIDRSLQLEGVAVLLASVPHGRWVVSYGHARDLAAQSDLAARLFDDARPVEVDWSRPDSVVRRLAADDRDWLVDGGFRLLIPIPASTGQPMGMIALAEKRSELPFSREDRVLLSAIALSVGLVIENQSGRRDRARPPLHEAPAADAAEIAECTQCGRLPAELGAPCPNCGQSTAACPVPLVLAEKFRVLRRVGAGGMGVVYEAMDLSLRRSVALKTLPSHAPQEVLRLRREARAMARVSHPNVAQIHGAESWRGVPILILEFMDGGSLAERLPRHRAQPREAVELGIVICDALENLHARGFIHRDIKPSNLGFTADGVPKLLDFGIAKMMGGNRASPVRPVVAAPVGTGPQDSTLSVFAAGPSSSVSAAAWAGTLLYMSPEALAGQPPDPMFDLWSLAVVLYEMVAGQHPLAGSHAPLGQVSEVPDIRSVEPACPAELAELFEAALSLDRSRRPSSARELGERLEALL
jgi:hypothetical protein